MFKSLLFSLFLFSCCASLAQRQVIVIKKDKIVDRYNTSDFISYSTSTPKGFVRDQIVELTDTTIITRNDTIPFHHIRLIEFLPPGLTVEKFGRDCIAAGVVLFLGDLVNVTVVQDNSYEFDSGVVITSATLLTTGIIFRLVGHEYLKIRMNNHLRIVDYNSPLYKKPFRANP